MPREVILLDDGVWPDETKQIVLLDDRAVPFDQHREHVDGLRCERDQRSVAPQQPAHGVEGVGARPDVYNPPPLSDLGRVRRARERRRSRSAIPVFLLCEIKPSNERDPCEIWLSASNQ